jgi:hypothetical protein
MTIIAVDSALLHARLARTSMSALQQNRSVPRTGQH